MQRTGPYLDVGEVLTASPLVFVRASPDGYTLLWANLAFGQLVLFVAVVKQIAPWHLSTRNGLMPAGQVSELRSYFYVCQTAADVDCD
jgi:hypothetical protein